MCVMSYIRLYFLQALIAIFSALCYVCSAAWFWELYLAGTSLQIGWAYIHMPLYYYWCGKLNEMSCFLLHFDHLNETYDIIFPCVSTKFSCPFKKIVTERVEGRFVKGDKIILLCLFGCEIIPFLRLTKHFIFWNSFVKVHLMCMRGMWCHWKC